MKKIFIVLVALTAIAIYAGIRAYNYAPYTGDGRIPLEPGFAETPVEYNAEDTLMLEWLTDKCISKGIIDVNNPNDIDSDKCVETICGMEANQVAGHSQIVAALKKCYDANH